MEGELSGSKKLQEGNCVGLRNNGSKTVWVCSNLREVNCPDTFSGSNLTDGELYIHYHRFNIFE